MALDPVVILTAVLEQVDSAVPATAVGAAVIVNDLVETALVQEPLPVAVRVRVITPLSPLPGVYMALVSEVGLLIMPVPLEVHTIPELLVAEEPVVIFTAVLEQVDTAVPATEVGAAVTVKVLVETALPHVPFPVAVRVRVTVLFSPVPGV